MIDFNDKSKPLFKPGFHNISITDLEKVFKENFGNNQRRLYLTERLKIFLDELKEIGGWFEIWINGSFTTIKKNPKDIDMVVIWDPNELSRDQEIELKNLSNRKVISHRYGIDLYLVSDKDEKSKFYWRGLFTYSRDEQVKGIVRFYLNEVKD